MTADQLRNLEGQVSDQRGCWVYFDKVIPVEEVDEAAAKGGAKKPPAGKSKPTTASAEDTKPIHGRAWLNLTPLLHPGCKNLTQRVFLQQISPAEAQYPASINTVDVGSSHGTAPERTGTVGTADDGETNPEIHDMFGENQSYLYLTVDLSEALYPEPDSKCIKESGADLVQDFPPAEKFPSTRDAIDDFEKTVRMVVS
jgi:hypothetical protein